MRKIAAAVVMLDDRSLSLHAGLCEMFQEIGMCTTSHDYLSFRKTLGRYLLGNHMARAHISTQRIASSSSIWPRKLRVA